ncbi:hypothetical protein cyc_03292 [Cyclospora cayetanensis]|uniref:Uncharacterized protein n=1 Tax=Cyclospora cayetanensis TaxID=88456 RepID=A0A1D3D8C6_9EIME|nr:hypothetical protein cyc_03292 [Cyclospora cayetanensis]
MCLLSLWMDRGHRNASEGAPPRQSEPWQLLQGYPAGPLGMSRDRILQEESFSVSVEPLLRLPCPHPALSICLSQRNSFKRLYLNFWAPIPTRGTGVLSVTLPPWSQHTPASAGSRGPGETPADSATGEVTWGPPLPPSASGEAASYTAIESGIAQSGGLVMCERVEYAPRILTRPEKAAFSFQDSRAEKRRGMGPTLLLEPPLNVTHSPNNSKVTESDCMSFPQSLCCLFSPQSPHRVRLRGGPTVGSMVAQRTVWSMALYPPFTTYVTTEQGTSYNQRHRGMHGREELGRRQTGLGKAAGLNKRDAKDQEGAPGAFSRQSTEHSIHPKRAREMRRLPPGAYSLPEGPSEGPSEDWSDIRPETFGLLAASFLTPSLSPKAVFTPGTALAFFSQTHTRSPSLQSLVPPTPSPPSASPTRSPSFRGLRSPVAFGIREALSPVGKTPREVATAGCTAPDAGLARCPQGLLRRQSAESRIVWKAGEDKSPQLDKPPSGKKELMRNSASPSGAPARGPWASRPSKTLSLPWSAGSSCCHLHPLQAQEVTLAPPPSTGSGSPTGKQRSRRYFPSVQQQPPPPGSLEGSASSPSFPCRPPTPRGLKAAEAQYLGNCLQKPVRHLGQAPNELVEEREQSSRFEDAPWELSAKCATHRSSLGKRFVCGFRAMQRSLGGPKGLRRAKARRPCSSAATVLREFVLSRRCTAAQPVAEPDRLPASSERASAGASGYGSSRISKILQRRGSSRVVPFSAEAASACAKRHLGAGRLGFSTKNRTDQETLAEGPKRHAPSAAWQEPQKPVAGEGQKLNKRNKGSEGLDEEAAGPPWAPIPSLLRIICRATRHSGMPSLLQQRLSDVQPAEMRRETPNQGHGEFLAAASTGSEPLLDACSSSPASFEASAGDTREQQPSRRPLQEASHSKASCHRTRTLSPFRMRSRLTGLQGASAIAEGRSVRAVLPSQPFATTAACSRWRLSNNPKAARAAERLRRPVEEPQAAPDRPGLRSFEDLGTGAALNGDTSATCNSEDGSAAALAPVPQAVPGSNVDLEKTNTCVRERPGLCRNSVYAEEAVWASAAAASPAEAGETAVPRARASAAQKPSAGAGRPLAILRPGPPPAAAAVAAAVTTRGKSPARSSSPVAAAQPLDFASEATQPASVTRPAATLDEPCKQAASCRETPISAAAVAADALSSHADAEGDGGSAMRGTTRALQLIASYKEQIRRHSDAPLQGAGGCVRQQPEIRKGLPEEMQENREGAAGATHVLTRSDGSCLQHFEKGAHSRRDSRGAEGPLYVHPTSKATPCGGRGPYNSSSTGKDAQPVGAAAVSKASLLAEDCSRGNTCDKQQQVLQRRKSINVAGRLMLQPRPCCAFLGGNPCLGSSGQPQPLPREQPQQPAHAVPAEGATSNAPLCGVPTSPEASKAQAAPSWVVEKKCRAAAAAAEQASPAIQEAPPSPSAVRCTGPLAQLRLQGCKTAAALTPEHLQRDSSTPPCSSVPCFVSNADSRRVAAKLYQEAPPPRSLDAAARPVWQAAARREFVSAAGGEEAGCATLESTPGQHRGSGGPNEAHGAGVADANVQTRSSCSSMQSKDYKLSRKSCSRDRRRGGGPPARQRDNLSEMQRHRWSLDRGGAHSFAVLPAQTAFGGGFVGGPVRLRERWQSLVQLRRNRRGPLRRNGGPKPPHEQSYQNFLKPLTTRKKAILSRGSKGFFPRVPVKEATEGKDGVSRAAERQEGQNKSGERKRIELMGRMRLASGTATTKDGLRRPEEPRDSFPGGSESVEVLHAKVWEVLRAASGAVVSVELQEEGSVSSPREACCCAQKTAPRKNNAPQEALHSLGCSAEASRAAPARVSPQRPAAAGAAAGRAARKCPQTRSLLASPQPKHSLRQEGLSEKGTASKADLSKALRRPQKTADLDHIVRLYKYAAIKQQRLKELKAQRERELAERLRHEALQLRPRPPPWRKPLAASIDSEAKEPAPCRRLCCGGVLLPAGGDLMSRQLSLDEPQVCLAQCKGGMQRATYKSPSAKYDTVQRHLLQQNQGLHQRLQWHTGAVELFSLKQNAYRMHRQPQQEEAHAQDSREATAAAIHPMMRWTLPPPRDIPVGPSRVSLGIQLRPTPLPLLEPKASHRGTALLETAYRPAAVARTAPRFTDASCLGASVAVRGSSAGRVFARVLGRGNEAFPEFPAAGDVGFLPALDEAACETNRGEAAYNGELSRPAWGARRPRNTTHEEVDWLGSAVLYAFVTDLFDRERPPALKLWGPSPLLTRSTSPHRPPDALLASAALGGNSIMHEGR